MNKKDKWLEIGVVALLMWVFSMFIIALVVIVSFINDITGKNITNHVVKGLLFIFIIYLVQKAVRDWLWMRSIRNESIGGYTRYDYESLEEKRERKYLEREERLKKEFEIRQALKRKEEKELQPERELARHKQDIRNTLNSYEKFIFERDRLTKEQISVLQEDGYELANEYCVLKKRVVPTYIRQILHHSKTHIFLVWSVKKFLKKYSGVEKIVEHETRDADLTFKYNGRKYALEIEIGSLLRKKKQLDGKVRYLNKKYRNRWMFVVSNRKLVKKYKKFGRSTQRKDFEKNFEKMLEN